MLHDFRDTKSPCASSVDQSRYLHRTDGGKSSRISGEISRIFLSCMICMSAYANATQQDRPHQAHSVHNCFSSCHLISTKLLFNRKKSRSQVLGSVDLEMCVWASEHGFGFSATPLAEILSHDRCTNLFQMGPAQLNGTQLPHIAPGCCQKSCPGAQLDSGGILSPCSFLPVRK